MARIRTEFHGLTTNQYYKRDGKDIFWVDPNTSSSSCYYWTQDTGWRLVSPDAIPEDIANWLREEHGFTYNNEEIERKTMTTVSKVLSMCLLVASNEFAKLSPAKQTEVLTGASGKPIVFVDSFVKLRNKKSLVERLLKGEDVSMELEFNEIELSDDERKALEGVRPVLERLRGPSGSYPWVELTDTQERSCRAIEISGGNIYRSGYNISKKQFEKLWATASAYWAGGEKPASYDGSFSGGYRKTVQFNDNTIAIGCQTLNRYEVEYVAQKLELEPAEVKEVA